MIRTIQININAAHPDLPLEAVSVFAGSAASFTIVNVPRALGQRQITGVAVEVKPNNVAQTFTATRVGSAWGVTVPASVFATPFSSTYGLRVIAYGKSDSGADAQWTLGVGDLYCLNSQGQITPGAEAGDIRHAEFSGIDPETVSVYEIATILKGATNA